MLARGHALYCRRAAARQYDPAKAMLALRVETSGQDNPVGRAVGASIDELEAECGKSSALLAATVRSHLARLPV